jgi:hypothetical protein
MSQKTVVPLVAAFALGTLAAVVVLRGGGAASYAADAPARPKPDDMTALKAEVDRLKGMVPDQSHVMADVGLHYSNLWFAGEQENWPLAQFCFDETRSHLHWAVRIIPVRKNLKGEEIRLTEILGAIDGTNLKTLGQTIAAKDKRRCPSSTLRPRKRASDGIAPGCDP